MNARLAVMYGHLEGTNGKFARDVSGYLALEHGIFSKHGLDVSWEHVQGTEERYRRLANGSAHISLVVGRASLQHYLSSGATRILGCAMNSCPYLLVAGSSGGGLAEALRGKIACRDGITSEVELQRDGSALRGAGEISLEMLPSDQIVFTALTERRVKAALLPRPYAFLAEESGFHTVREWPEIVDDPLPITVETTAALFGDRAELLSAFITAHSEAIAYLKSHPVETRRLLQDRFQHSATLAHKMIEGYFPWMNEMLTVDRRKFRQLLTQIAPERAADADGIAEGWIRQGALVR